MSANEEEILKVFIEEMESNGVNRKLVRFDINEEMLEKINADKKLPISLEDLRKAADRCLANEWLEHRVMAGQYGQLGISTTGVGVIRSRQKKEQQLRNRSWPKKASDYIEDHKGLFIALGAVVAISGLLIKLFGGGTGE